MAVFGLFFAGGTTALLGVLEYLPVKGAIDNPDMEYIIIAFTLRVANSLGNTAFDTAAMTLIAVTFPENTALTMSYTESVLGLGIMAGPAIGSGAYKLGGFMATFAIDGALIVVCSIIMYFALPFNVGCDDDDQAESVPVFKLLTNINIAYGLVLTSYNAAIWVCLDPILEPELRKKYGISQELSALAFLLLSVTYSVFAVVVGKALQKVKCLDGMYVQVFGYVIVAINFIIMGPSPLLTPWINRPLWLLLTCIGVLGAGLGFTLVPTLALLYESSLSVDDIEGSDRPGEERGNERNTATNAMISSFFYSAYALGDWVGPVISGAVINKTNFGWTITVYFFTSIVVIISILLLKIHECVRRRRRRQDQTSSLTTLAHLKYGRSLNDESFHLLTSYEKD